MSHRRASIAAMEQTSDQRIAAVAATHFGYFTAAQADRAGLTRDQRAKRVRSGRWELVHPNVYRIAGAPDSWRGRLLATCWAAHGLSAASHRAAAGLWDLPEGAELLEISCRRWRRSFFDGLVVHETKLLLDDDITEVDGIPVTSVEQTLLGLAAVMDETVVEMAIDRALQRNLTTGAKLDAFVDLKGARGRNGVGVLRQLRRLHDPLAGIPESAMETKLKRLLRAHDFPTPEFQYTIRDHGRFVARVDAAYPDLRIAIEFDSYEHHTGKLAVVRDNDRRNRLKQIRWDTVTFTAADLANDGGHALDALRAARAARAQSLPVGVP
jgi:hypothetical protein